MGSTYAKKAESIANTISLLRNTLRDSGSFLRDSKLRNHDVSKALEELENGYQEIVVALINVDPKNDKTLSKFMDSVEKLRIHSINEFYASVADKINLMVSKVSPLVINTLFDQLSKLQEEVKLLSSPATDATAVWDAEINFRKTFAEVYASTENAALLESSLLYQEINAIAHQEGKRQLPSEIYTYILSGRDLRDSQNEFIQDQLRLNSTPIHNDNKFSLSGSLPDNLFQIRKDAERNLTLDNTEFKYDQDQEEALKGVLIEKYGIKNTENMIRHFDQGVSLMIVSPLTTALESKEGVIGEVISPSPEKFTSKYLYAGWGNIQRCCGTIPLF